MVIFELLNLPLLIGAIVMLLFFIWLAKHAERMDKKRENIKKSQSMRKKLQKMKSS
jgi:hypothetical protein